MMAGSIPTVCGYPIRNANFGLRSAFSLVELLVVIGLVGILLGLLFPAVQYARESSRRLQCVSRLHEIGVATHSYVAVKRVFPPGLSPRAWSLHTHLLPYMEQNSLYEQFDKTRTVIEEPNTRFTNTRIASFQCPSVPNPAAAATHYLGCVGTEYVSMRNDARNDGVFIGVSAGIQPKDILDGLSNTTLFAETVSNGRWGKLRPLQYRGSVERTADACLNVEEMTVWPVGEPWIMSGLGHSLYNHALPPNRPSCEAGGGPLSIVTSASYHSNGVNVLFADARVVFVSEDVDFSVWQAYAARSDGGLVVN